MILDLPLPGAKPSDWGKGRIRGQKVGSFVCDGVSFRDFAVSVDRERGKKVKVTFT